MLTGGGGCSVGSQVRLMKLPTSGPSGNVLPGQRYNNVIYRYTAMADQQGKTRVVGEKPVVLPFHQLKFTREVMR